MQTLLPRLTCRRWPCPAVACCVVLRLGAAGWGNTGFGVTLLLMPLLYKLFTFFWGPQVAWRAAFFVPAGLQLAAGLLVLPLTDDTPEGRLSNIHRCGVHPGCCRHTLPASLLAASTGCPGVSRVTLLMSWVVWCCAGPAVAMYPCLKPEDSCEGVQGSMISVQH